MALESTQASNQTSNIWADKTQMAPSSESNARQFADLMAASQVETNSSNLVSQETLTQQATDADATEDQFLTLLLAQMNNQDPLNPLDNAQVTTQLAQISTVSGIEELNTTMETLLGKFGSSSPVDAAAMIDRAVLVTGDQLTLTDQLGQTLNAGAELSSSASAVSVEIFGQDGDPVRTIALGAQAAGLVTFEWDGLDADGEELAAGSYQFQVSSQSESGVQLASPLAASQVTGVTRAGESLSYRLANGTTISPEQVRGVF